MNFLEHMNYIFHLSISYSLMHKAHTGTQLSVVYSIFLWNIYLFGNVVSNHAFSNYSLFNLHFFLVIAFLNNPIFEYFSFISSFIPP